MGKWAMAIAVVMYSMTALAASTKWTSKDNETHSYWQANACWAFVDSATASDKTVLEVYSDKDQEFGRPLVQVITELPDNIYEATLYFNSNPNGKSYELLRIGKADQPGKKVLALPSLDKDVVAEALDNMIRLSSAHVTFKNDKGKVKTVKFSLSKSSINIRYVLDNCFTDLSDSIKKI